MKKRDIWISVAIIAIAVLAFYFYSQGKGRIKIDAGGAAATLHLRSSWLSKATISSGAEPSKVSSRVHRPVQLSLSMKQDSNTWQLDSRGPWGDLSTIKVTKNNATVLKLGPPFLVKTNVRKSGSNVSIDFAVIGNAGEHYGNSIMRNNQRAPAPKLEIVDEAGNVLASGKFAYG